MLGRLAGPRRCTPTASYKASARGIWYLTRRRPFSIIKLASRTQILSNHKQQDRDSGTCPTAAFAHSPQNCQQYSTVGRPHRNRAARARALPFACCRVRMRRCRRAALPRSLQELHAARIGLQTRAGLPHHQCHEPIASLFPLAFPALSQVHPCGDTRLPSACHYACSCAQQMCGGQLCADALHASDFFSLQLKAESRTSDSPWTWPPWARTSRCSRISAASNVCSCAASRCSSASARSSHSAIIVCWWDKPPSVLLSKPQAETGETLFEHGAPHLLLPRLLAGAACVKHTALGIRRDDSHLTWHGAPAGRQSSSVDSINPHVRGCYAALPLASDKCKPPFRESGSQQ